MLVCRLQSTQRSIFGSFTWTSLLSRRRGVLDRTLQPVPGPQSDGSGADRAAACPLSGPGEDRGLPDVAVRASPPNLSIAAAAHVLRRQRPVAGGVPLPHQAGMRGGKIVEAGQHPAPRAVGTAVSRRTGIDSGLVGMALGTAPPDQLVAAAVDRFGSAAVFRHVPFSGQRGVRDGQVVEAAQHLFPCAIGAARSGGSAEHDLFVAVSLRAAPPDALVRAAGQLPGRDGVALVIPLREQNRVRRGQIGLTGNGPVTGAVGTAGTGAERKDRRLPCVTAAAAPPDAAVGGRHHVPRRQAAVFLLIPQRGDLRPQRCQIRFPRDGLLTGAIGTALPVPDPCRKACLPVVPPGTDPPNTLAGLGRQRGGIEVRVFLPVPFQKEIKAVLRTDIVILLFTKQPHEGMKKAAGRPL